MKKINSLTILFIVTIVMVTLMIITIQRPNVNDENERLLFPELFEQLSSIDSIQLKSNQDEFTLYKQGENWFIKERWGFPADFNLVKRTLIDLSEAQILERKTADPEQHFVLGLEGFDKGGDSIHITLLSNEKEIAGLVLGLERELDQIGGERQFYVRRANENKTWLAEGYLNINPLMLNWIKSEVINIARERIAQVNIIQPDGTGVTLINLGEKDKFGTPEAGHKTIFKYEQLGYDIAGSLFQLRMEDVQALAGFSRAGAEVVISEFITFDGLKVVVETSFDADAGNYNSTFKAKYDASSIKAAPKDIQALAVLKTTEQVQQEADLINAQLSNWVYRFGGFVGTNLMRAKADMITESEKVIPMPIDPSGLGL